MKKKKEIQLRGIASFMPAVLIMLMCSANMLQAQGPRNCSMIHYVNPAAPSGVYTIDPDGGGPQPSMKCRCDMTTDGGGWTLVLNYNHLANTNPPLKVFTDSLPMQGEITLGFDESNTEYWGHADTAIMHAMPFDEVRFYGITADHNRVIDFKTSHPGTVSYFKTGLGSTEGIRTDFTPMAAHTAFLPAAIDMTVTNMGNYAMTAYPLWTGSTYHWYLGGADPLCFQRWEVDDYPCTTPSTFHQIWVRQNNSLGVNDLQQNRIEINLSPNPFSDFAQLTIGNCKPELLAHARVTVFNLLGKQVYPFITRNTGSFTIGKGSLVPGVYICKLVGDAGVLSTTRMIVK
jgi:hypothetical protein